MLSSVAERTYWLGRSVERAENTSRFVSVNSHLLLDLPRNVRIGWGVLVDICGANEAFNARYKNVTQDNVTKFLLTLRDNPSSLINSLHNARENARTTREIIPSEAWEHINNLYLYARDLSAKGISKGMLHEFLEETITQCQLITGLLISTMSHDSAYRFIQLGRHLERADMITRMLDVGCANLLKGAQPDEAPQQEYENILWMSILRSASAYQMYRQHVRERVSGKDVVAFLLQDTQFPRALAYCLRSIENAAGRLCHHDNTQRAVAAAKRRVLDIKVEDLLEDGLHEFIDTLQLDFIGIHDCIAATWFPALESYELAQASA